MICPRVIFYPAFDSERRVSYNLYFSGKISSSGRILKMDWSTSIDDALIIDAGECFWKVYNRLCRTNPLCGFFTPDDALLF